MRVGVIQSNYIPWRGYFDFIASVDLFVIYDDIQYTKGGWRNRNRLRVNAGGCRWMTIPIPDRKLSQLINATMASTTVNWRKEHMNQFVANYAKAPHFELTRTLYERCLSEPSANLSIINTHAIHVICAYLGIKTPIVRSEALNLLGSKTDRLIDLLVKVKATSYLSGPSAESYLDKNLFLKNGIALEYKNYNYPDYKQVHGGFEPAVTVLDLIANLGNRSMDFMKSTDSDKRVA